VVVTQEQFGTKQVVAKEKFETKQVVLETIH
jgi:hypothetical protein